MCFASERSGADGLKQLEWYALLVHFLLVRTTQVFELHMNKCALNIIDCRFITRCLCLDCVRLQLQRAQKRSRPIGGLIFR